MEKEDIIEGTQNAFSEFLNANDKDVNDCLETALNNAFSNFSTTTSAMLVYF